MRLQKEEERSRRRMRLMRAIELARELSERILLHLKVDSELLRDQLSQPGHQLQILCIWSPRLLLLHILTQDFQAGLLQLHKPATLSKALHPVKEILACQIPAARDPFIVFLYTLESIQVKEVLLKTSCHHHQVDKLIECRQLPRETSKETTVSTMKIFILT